jgi:hypothetical protein
MVRVDGSIELHRRDRQRSVNALDVALQGAGALLPRSSRSAWSITNSRARGRRGHRGVVRVLIESQDARALTTVGVSQNVVEAS